MLPWEKKVSKRLKQPKHPLRDEWIKKWIKKIWYIHTMEYYSAVKWKTNKKKPSVICYNMGEACGYYANWNVSPWRTDTAWFHLYEVSKVIKLIEAQSKNVAARIWGEREMGSCCSMGIKFQSSKIKKKKALEIC